MTLYLWDMANTLFPEKWNPEITGFADFGAYVKSLGVDAENPRVFEECYKEPYIHGERFNLRIADGFADVLSWTKHNETFTTGIREQMDWRAEYLNLKVGFDIIKYFQKIISTFDFGETNVKTQEMLEKYLARRKSDGYNAVVYTDDKLANCEMFKKAAESVGISFRVYNMKNDSGGLRNEGWYWEIGNLYDLLKNEKNYEK
ncbi:MAG: hypothetical protein HY569_01635 [Candidatus Magasanikbacteria bacterium]|nr:hypothetical protein [Candidatus Magasanikbacteria bacterium]